MGATIHKVPFVYIARCADGSLYTGYAEDVARRIAAHNAGQGARYTAGRRPVTLVYMEPCESRGAALRRECAIKRLPRSAKEALVLEAAAKATRGRGKRRGGPTKRQRPPGPEVQEKAGGETHRARPPAGVRRRTG